LDRVERAEPTTGLHPATRRGSDGGRQHRAQTQRTIAAAIHTHLSNGNTTRAANCINANPLAQVTPALTAQLQALRPAEPPLQVRTLDTPPLAITAGHLAKVLVKLAKGKAGGPSGWTYEHVNAAAFADPSCMDALLRFINPLVKGTLPHLVQLLDCHLVATHKPGSGIQPIAIGKVWVQIPGLCALAANPTAGQGLQSLQVGEGLPRGAECVGHALGTALVAQPNTAIARIDFPHAFNAVGRGSTHRRRTHLVKVWRVVGRPAPTVTVCAGTLRVPQNIEAQPTQAQPIGLEYALPKCAVWSLDPHTGNHIASAVGLPLQHKLPLHPTKPWSKRNLLIQLSWQCDTSFCSH
jgi:hypothetical protein